MFFEEIKFHFRNLPFLTISNSPTQAAIGKADGKRAEAGELPPNRHRRTFANLTIAYCFRVRSAIGKDDEAGNTRARLYHQFTFAVPFDALLNRSRNFHSRADNERQPITRRLHVRTVERVSNRRQSESLNRSLSHFPSFVLSQLASRHRLIKTGWIRWRTPLSDGVSFSEIAHIVIVKAEKFPVERHKFGGWIHSRQLPTTIRPPLVKGSLDSRFGFARFAASDER